MFNCQSTRLCGISSQGPFRVCRFSPRQALRRVLNLLRSNMDFELYLAPLVALLFFFLVAIITYCCYSRGQVSRKDREVHLKEAELIVVETKKGSHSAVEDFFIIRHL